MKQAHGFSQTPEERLPVLLPRWLLAIVSVSVVLLALLLRGTPQALSPFYYAIMCLLGWFALSPARGPHLRTRLRRLPGPPLLRAVMLGYAAVAFEETIVGTLFALNEGITPSLWAERVAQFIAFNLLAFTGAIWGLTLACRWMPGLTQWHLLVAGAWGIFAERSYLIFLGNPIAGALIAGPNIAVYTIILAPMVLSLPPQAAGVGARPWAPFIAWALMLVLSLPPVGLLLYLRGVYPAAFPDCEYISCI